MSKPRITVIIPTRERCDVLEKSLRTVTAQDYDNLEIIVSDNFSGDATCEVVRAANDPRIRYLNTGKRLSMSHNWEFALSHVEDGWVSIIGDDDGLLPGCLTKISEVVRSFRVLAIRTKVCGYSWPSLTGKEFGLLRVPFGNGSEVRGTRRWLDLVLTARANYTDLPMLYNGGFVSMAVLKEIKGKTRAIYQSCIPDVYSAVAISSSIDRYVYLAEPVAINGASKHSTGSAQFKAEGGRDESPAKKFQSETNIPFHDDVPLMPDGSFPVSIQAFIYESYLQSAALRPGEDSPQHAEQLKLILATASRRHLAAVMQWGRLFADRHGLNFETVAGTAFRTRLLIKAKAQLKWPGPAWKEVGSREEPIRDVYEASLVAARICQKPRVK